MIYKIFFVLCFSLFSFFAIGQSKVDMADAMRSNGKIYVVIAIILTIFAGLIFYLIRIDRKITKIEKGSS
jgi:preprotein translocase subunit YajC